MRERPTAGSGIGTGGPAKPTRQKDGRAEVRPYMSARMVISRGAPIINEHVDEFRTSTVRSNM